MNPFEIVKAVTHTKENLMVDVHAEKGYTPYMVNRALSFFVDTVFQANEMNRNYHLDNKLQFDYLLNNIRPRKRWSQWLKPEKIDNIDIVKEYYEFSNEKAKNALEILSVDQLEHIKQKLDIGGVEK
jgi:hypothetical protein|tara:strand:- start:57 stop:437 length:381 start_codon:yes stop_codon:yes gene_type:complete